MEFSLAVKRASRAAAEFILCFVSFDVMLSWVQ